MSCTQLIDQIVLLSSMATLIRFSDSIQTKLLSAKGIPCIKRTAGKLQLLPRKDRSHLGKRKSFWRKCQGRRGIEFNEMKEQETWGIIKSQKISLSVQQNPHLAVLPPSLKLKFNLVSKGRGKTCIIKHRNQWTVWRKRSQPLLAAQKVKKEKVKIYDSSALTLSVGNGTGACHPTDLSLPLSP